MTDKCDEYHDKESFNNNNNNNNNNNYYLKNKNSELV